jgi:hypothetical protein
MNTIKVMPLPKPPNNAAAVYKNVVSWNLSNGFLLIRIMERNKENTVGIPITLIHDFKVIA